MYSITLSRLETPSINRCCNNELIAPLLGLWQQARELGIVNILALRGGQQLIVLALLASLLCGSCACLRHRPDPPRGQEYWVAANDEFQHATDLVRYIRRQHGDTFCIGVAGKPTPFPLPTAVVVMMRTGALTRLAPGAGYPEGHADSDDKLADIEYLFQKQEAGADFVVTQLFYCVDKFMTWHDACRDRGQS